MKHYHISISSVPTLRFVEVPQDDCSVALAPDAVAVIEAETAAFDEWLAPFRAALAARVSGCPKNQGLLEELLSHKFCV